MTALRMGRVSTLPRRERGGPIPREKDGVFRALLRTVGRRPVVLYAPEESGGAEHPRAGGAGGDGGVDQAIAVPTMVAARRWRASGTSSCAAAILLSFLNLQIHESGEQVGAHISSIGGATPGFKYCMDAAIGATPVPFDTWQCAAISYDGKKGRAWLNGELDPRGERNPYMHAGGIFDGGPNGG